jgi:hypothetical protein
MVAPRRPSTQEREALVQFARLEISLDDLCSRLQGMLSIDFSSKERHLTSHLIDAEPGIEIEKQHVQHALEERTRGAITTRQLSDWAGMLIMNTAYDWEGLDEQVIDELNELALF